MTLIKGGYRELTTQNDIKRAMRQLWHSWMPCRSPRRGMMMTPRQPGGTMSEPKGIPAIPPHLNADDPTLLAFTAAEAQAYVGDPTNYLEISNWLTQMHPMGSFTVASVQFMTTAKVEQLLGIAIRLATDAPACVVELHGRFQIWCSIGSTHHASSRYCMRSLTHGQETS